MLKINLVWQYISLSCVLILSISCNEKERNNIDWPMYLGDAEMSHYSTSSQINKDNVNQLEVAWKYNTLDSGDFQCNPLIIGGILYGISAASNVFALNASTGEEIWKFEPSEKKHYLKNRGVSYWEDGQDKRILFSYDEWIYSLHARTGKPDTTFGEDGRTTLRTGLGESSEGKYLMSRTPGTIVEDLLIMPTVMMERAGSAPGFLQAFNVRTGALEWVFHTIPMPGEYGYDTWPADVHVKGVVGGANNWSGISYDKKRGIIYVPTGSAGPDFFGGSRKGENLFANTILAIDAQTGKRIWHYQIVKHDIWDRDLPAPTNLTSIMHEGKSIDVVAQITKSGHVFVLDRDNGTPVYPVEEIHVPASPVKEESAWPIQVLPKIPAPFARQDLEETDLNRLSPDYDSLMTVFRSSKKGLFLPFSDVPTMIFPGLTGGGEWGGAAIDLDGVMYVNANELPWVATLKRHSLKSDLSLGELTYINNCSTCHGVDRKAMPASGFPSLVNIGEKLGRLDIEETIKKGRGMMPGFYQISKSEMESLVQFLLNNETIDTKQENKSPLYEAVEPWGLEGYNKFLDSEGNPGIKPPWGTLSAIDLNSGLQLWQVPLGENKPYMDKHGILTGLENYGGPIVTSSGLIFIGASSDNKIRAFDRKSGLQLWEYELPFSGFSTPSTYMVDGVQYVVIACGGTKLGLPRGDQLIAFKLSTK